MLPYLLWPGPLGLTDEALVGDLVLVSHVPGSFLAPSITFIATFVTAGPLLGAPSPVLGNRLSSHFWDPLKLWSFDQLDVIPVPLIGWRVGRVLLIRDKLITLMLVRKLFFPRRSLTWPDVEPFARIWSSADALNSSPILPSDMPGARVV